MSANGFIGRRGFIHGALLAALISRRSSAQGFAGLGSDAGGFAAVIPGKALTFPADHGPHPDYRTEWWYLTSNLKDAAGVAYGVQWTLFRQALVAGPQSEGWANNQIWMAHAAVTRADLHRFSERLARGGVGQAGVDAKPFRAWIDAWEMRGLDQMSDMMVAPMNVRAQGTNFSFDLRLDARRPLILEGDAGYSQKSERGQASYYYSQPFFEVAGSIIIDDVKVQVTGPAWMDREWSSQPLASDQTGWDWFSLHLDTGEKLMLFRLRQTDGKHYLGGTWVSGDGTSRMLSDRDFSVAAMAWSKVSGRNLPTQWKIEVPLHGLQIETVPLNPQSWMGTRFAYWEGPIVIRGSTTGVGYLEMTGY
jgi:predicted secreted hydrolase